jgi:K(+)-stimulated pyrophosphate-energized sodium pump
MELAIVDRFANIAPFVGAAFLVVALIFVWRSFYKMRVKS